MKKFFSLLLVMIMMAALVVTGCGGQTGKEPADGKPEYKAGFIYVGPIGDGGFTYAHNEGRLYLEEKLGIPTIYKESVPEDQTVEKVISDMVDQGCNIIFGTSFGFMDYMERVAPNYPDVKFFHCSGYKTAENMTNYFGKIEEARYLTGIVAGMKTETNKIGYVAAYGIPEVVRGLNAFALGVQSVNPDATVEVVWTQTWYDPATEKEAAKVLLDKGCDVIAQHQDTAGPQQAAEERGAFSIGYNTDMTSTAPKAHMVSAVWNWGAYYVKAVQDVMNGKFSNEPYLGDMKEGLVDISPLTANAPEGAKEKVEEAKKAIISGEFKLFAGPLKDNQGNLRVKEGEVMSLEDQYSNFDWLVEGVIGSVE
ncbi:MAG: BMP family ABC transporter substrate-binding protein [Peptococcia bacterium]